MFIAFVISTIFTWYLMMVLFTVLLLHDLAEGEPLNKTKVVVGSIFWFIVLPFGAVWCLGGAVVDQWRDKR